MGILATPRPVRALALQLTGILSALLAPACGSQEPAFSESRAVGPQADEATGVRPAGVETLDPGAIAGVDAAVDAGTDATAGHDADGAADSGSEGAGADGAGADGAGADGNGGDGNGADGAGTDASGTDSGADGGLGGGPGDDAGDSGGDGMSDSGSDGGLGYTPRTVEVTQPGAGKVDILWIVDTSGSMAEEQQYLANNFNSLITQLNNAGHDFQTAVTTTDVCQNSIPGPLSERVCPVDYGGSAATRLRGSFRGDVGRKVLKKGDADLIAKFNAYTNAGVDASGFEHGLEAAHLAIQKVLNGTNEPLIRSDAFLAVIVVSDEEDDGIGLSQVDAYHGHNFVAEGLTTFRWTENDMISYLQGTKGAGKFSISSIVPTRLSNGQLCSAPHTQPLEEGKQYILAAQKSGGVVQSLCDTNWSASLASIGLDLNAQITQIALPSIAVPASIKVWVNGTLSTHWTYNAGNNAVKFDAGQVPAPGAQIKVTYNQVP